MPLQARSLPRTGSAVTLLVRFDTMARSQAAGHLKDEGTSAGGASFGRTVLAGSSSSHDPLMESAAG